MTSSARNQVAINLGFTLLKSVFVLFSLSLADTLLAAPLMGLVLLLRRQGALWGNLLQLGLSQSLQKFYIASADDRERRQLWATLVRWVALATGIAILLCGLFGNTISFALLGRSDAAFGWAIGIYMSGIALGYMACSSWMAEFRFVQSNLIDWLNGSLIFVLCLLLGHQLGDIALVFWLAGLTVVAPLLSLVWFMNKNGGQSELRTARWKPDADVCKFGFTRALTAFADMGTLVLGPWLLKHQPEKAGYLILSYTAIRLAQAVVLPVAQVLALRANSHYHDQSLEERRVLWLCGLAFAGGGLSVGFYYLVGDWLVSLWLPSSFQQVIPLLDRLMPFLPAVCIFYALRNFVDLRFKSPINLYALLFALLLFVASFFMSNSDGADAAVFSSQLMFGFFYVYGTIITLVMYKRTVS